MPTTEDIIQRIVEQEVYVNASMMISSLVEASDLVPFEELLPCLEQPDYSEAQEGYIIKRDGMFGEWNVWLDDELGTSVASNLGTEREAIAATWEDDGEEAPREEALQHWLVSDWLADKLEAAGAMVARDVLGFNVWGRSECGQALTEDSDILAVASRLQD